MRVISETSLPSRGGLTDRRHSMEEDGRSTDAVVMGNAEWMVASSKRRREVQSSPTTGSCQHHGGPKRSRAVVTPPRNGFVLVPLCAVSPPRECLPFQCLFKRLGRIWVCDALPTLCVLWGVEVVLIGGGKSAPVFSLFPPFAVSRSDAVSQPANHRWSKC